MADAGLDKSAGHDGDERRLPTFGCTVFLPQAAHVAVLDVRGRIMTVNDAWMRFGGENGLAKSYQFIGISYPEICERAVDAKRGGEDARAALGGINKILAAQERRFSMIYPCHAPERQRWFLMFARPIGADAEGAVISHVDVTSLHQAGLLSDESARSGAASPKRAADRLAQMILPDLWEPFGNLSAAPTITVAWATPTAPTSTTTYSSRRSIVTSPSIPPAISNRS